MKLWIRDFQLSSLLSKIQFFFLYYLVGWWIAEMKGKNENEDDFLPLFVFDFRYFHDNSKKNYFSIESKKRTDINRKWNILFLCCDIFY